MSPELLSDLKAINWQKVINVSAALGDLNDAQLRFAKGLAIEYSVEGNSLGILQYVGEKHKDFNCSKYQCTFELKSVVSHGIYNRQGKLKSLPGIRLNNSMGTNSQTLDPAHVTDYLIAVLSDGVFVTDRATVIANAKHKGDGWVLNLKADDVIMLSGQLTVTEQYQLHLAEKIRNAIKNAVSSV